MRVVIRADASVWIGSGHIMRCLVLADALRQRGAKVVFTCVPQAGDLISLIESKGFNLVCLTAPSKLLTPRHDSDYEAWLQRTNLADAEDFISKIVTADWVVVDHYGINEEWESTIKNQLSCSILAIDDLNRQHCCDLILDQNLSNNQDTRYRSCKAQKLLGPSFALLRPSFAKLKQYPPVKKDQVLAFFGGTDPTRECSKLLGAISQLSPLPFVVKVVTGRSCLDFEKLKEFEKTCNVEVSRYLDDFDNELASSRYAIGASGVSNWERFCLHVPSSIVSVADNQRELSEFLSEENYVRFIGNGSKTTADDYRFELIKITQNWNSWSSFREVDVDGLGAQRVVDVMESFYV